MAEKDMEKVMCSCGCGCCGMGGGMWMGKKLYMTVGTFAFVYGFVTWLMMTQNWPAYGGWMLGGVLLIAIGVVKKWFWKMRMSKGM